MRQLDDMQTIRTRSAFQSFIKCGIISFLKGVGAIFNVSLSYQMLCKRVSLKLTFNGLTNKDEVITIRSLSLSIHNVHA